MNPAARQRLQIEFDRASVAKRIGIALAIIGLASCQSHKDSEFPKLTEAEKQAFAIMNQ